MSLEMLIGALPRGAKRIFVLPWIRSNVGRFPRFNGKKEGKKEIRRKKKPPLRQNLWRFGARAPRLARRVVVFSSDSEGKRNHRGGCDEEEGSQL